MVAGVVGLGGAGKSALAVRVAHDVRTRFPDGQLHAELRAMSGEPADPAAVLAGFLRALGAPHVPDDAAERAALFRSVTADRRILVLLDDVGDATQARPLIPGGPGCAVLLTGRSRLLALPGARWLPLGVLDEGEAVDLLAAIAGPDRVRAEPADARRVVRAAGLLPLAVRIAGTLLTIRPQWTLKRLADRLAERRVDELRVPGLAVADTFEASRRRLDPAHARAFGLLAVAGPAITPAAAAAVLDTGEDAAEQLLDHLADAHLVEASPAGYRYHELVRDFARAGVSGADRAAAARRLADHFLATARNAFRCAEPASLAPGDVAPTRSAGAAFGSADDARDWFRTEHAAALSGVDSTADADLLLMFIRLPDFGFGETLLRAAARRVAEAAAEQGDERAEGRARYVLARLATHGHYFTAAASDVAAALRLAHRAGDRRVAETSRALTGLVHIGLSRPDAAVRSLSAALRQSRALADHQRTAITLGNLANVRRGQGRTGAALALIAEGRALANSIGDPMAQLFTGHARAMVLLETGRATEAETLALRGLGQAEELRFPRWQAAHHTLLARIHLRSGRVRPALDRAEQAVDLGRRLDRPDSTKAALHSLSEALTARGDHGGAEAAEREAATLAARLRRAPDRPAR